MSETILEDRNVAHSVRMNRSRFPVGSRSGKKNICQLSDESGNHIRGAGVLKGRGLLAMKSKSLPILITGLSLAVGVAGCRVHVDKGNNGEEKNVQVDTPFGGVHVNTDEVSASDLGLPAYPGAHQFKGDDDHKSADIHMGFGQWQLRIRAVSYATTDSQDKVAAFYKKALARYGDVLTCQGKVAVGTPTVTAEGLNCADNGKGGGVQIDDNDFGSKDGLQLKAGSKRHQHIVGFEHPKNGKTLFALVALDLPANMDKGSDHSD